MVLGDKPRSSLDTFASVLQRSFKIVKFKVSDRPTFGADEMVMVVHQTGVEFETRKAFGELQLGQDLSINQVANNPVERRKGNARTEFGLEVIS